MKQIYFCILLTNQSSAEFTSKILLNHEIVSYTADNHEQALNILNTKNIDFLFIDLDFPDNISQKFLNSVKNDERLMSIFILATSINANDAFIKKLKNYNIMSFISKPLKKDILENKIQFILEKFKNHFARRKYIRIVPDNDELMRASFKLNNGKSLSAKIVNLSLGGFAVLLYADYNSSDLMTGKLIEHINFTANNRDIDIDARIISKNGKFIAFQHTHFYGETYKSLCKYVIKKVSV